MDAPPVPEIRYTLMQHSLDVPSVDGLRRAFESVRTLIAADAPTIARDAFGILVKDLGAQDALVLKEALGREGIVTELVPQSLLPQLPATKFVRQFSFGEDTLLIQDPLGRPVPLEYRHLRIMAVGEVEVVRFDRPGPQFSDSGPRFLVPSALRLERQELDRPRASRTREIRTRKHFIELIVGHGAARFTMEADTDAHLLFKALGNRRKPDFLDNLSLLVRKLAQAAPRMVLNRGAFALRTEPPSTFSYPTRNAFYEELLWILWQASRNHYGEQET